MLGLNEMGILIAGAVSGIILAVLGAVLYRVGVFLLVFISVSCFCIYVINPQDWILAAVCLAIGLLAEFGNLVYGYTYDPVHIHFRGGTRWKRSLLSASDDGRIDSYCTVRGILYHWNLCTAFT